MPFGTPPVSPLAVSESRIEWSCPADASNGPWR